MFIKLADIVYQVAELAKKMEGKFITFHVSHNYFPKVITFKVVRWIFKNIEKKLSKLHCILLNFSNYEEFEELDYEE